MGKYIIDTDQFTHRFNPSCIGVYGIGKDIDDMDEKVVWSRMVNIDDLDELNPKYIEENFDGLFYRKYQHGFEDGKAQGMSDLMTAIRKLISHVDSSDWVKIGFKFNIDGWGDRLLEILKNYLPSEIITKVKAYEQKQEDNAKRDIQNDLDYLMTQTGMTVDEISQRLKEMRK